MIAKKLRVEIGPLYNTLTKTCSDISIISIASEGQNYQQCIQVPCHLSLQYLIKQQKKLCLCIFMLFHNYIEILITVELYVKIFLNICEYSKNFSHCYKTFLSLNIVQNECY